ncbi:MAG: hypothetical protein R6U58_12615 [Bacteroidales bacterium]
MTLFEIIFTLIAAVLIGILFYHIFRYSGPWGSLWTFLLILIIAGLAGAAWIEPVGPVYREVAWIPILFVIIVFAVFLAAVTPPNSRRGIEAAQEDSAVPRDEVPFIALSGLFWFLFILLLVAAVWGILR